jgi:TrmH family RNA methyltransferase
MLITSKDNETIKHIRKLKEKKYRDEYGEYIVEGIKLINEAIEEKQNVKTIIVCDNCNKEALNQNSMYEVAKLDCIYVDEKVFNTITEVKNPQGILAVVEKQNKEKQINFNEDIIVVLDDIQDPGNLGTILRTVDSVGLSQIIVSKKSGDVYNSKVVRSTMGAIFRVNVIESENLKDTIKEIKKHKFNVISTSLDTDKSLYDINLNKTVIVIGNEANGVSKEIQELSDTKIIIPMLGKTESLNASVATGIVLYEYVRQKISK